MSVTVAKDVTEKIKVPRAIFLPWPMGHHFGFPFHRDLQRRVLFEVFYLLESADVRNDPRCANTLGRCPTGGEDAHGAGSKALRRLLTARPFYVFHRSAKKHACRRADQDHSPMPDQDVKYVQVRAVDFQHAETG